MNAGGTSTAPWGREGLRVAALAALVFGLSVVRPTVLVGVPFLVLLLASPTRRPAALVVGLAVALLVFGGGEGDRLWYVERAWAVLLGGWFAAVTLRWPELRLFARAGVAVAGAAAVVAAVLAVRPGAWSVLDALVRGRIQQGVAAGLEAMRLMSGQAPSPALLATVQSAIEFQGELFPALLGLASLAAVGLAWWLYQRLGQGPGPVLAPVREFRFNDHLVWVLIAGLVVLVAGWGEAWGRAGSNAVLFMAGLYALRGVAVVLFVSGGFSFLGGVFLLVAVLFTAPFVAAVALCIGLGDTWMDLRQRSKRLPV